MEISCSRCHQTVQAENCYCPVCGLPQLVYATDGAPGQAQQERWNEATRDASSVDWKPALRAALMMAIPAGVLSSEASQAGHLGLIWMATAAGLAVMLYARGQRPAWITLGAGGRGTGTGHILQYANLDDVAGGPCRDLGRLHCSQLLVLAPLRRRRRRLGSAPAGSHPQTGGLIESHGCPILLRSLRKGG